MKRSLLDQSTEKTNLLTILNGEQNGKELIQSLTQKKYRKHQYIYQSGDAADRIYIIKKGRIKIGNNYDYSRAIIKNVLNTGDLFGEFSLLGQAGRMDFARAMDETEVYIITTSELNELMRNYDRVTVYMMNVLGSRLMETEQKLESFVFKKSRTRIIDFLRQLASRRGQPVGYEMLVRGFFTHQEIANITATSRQTVTTVLNELRKKNILTFNRRRLLIRDLALLQAEVA